MQDAAEEAENINDIKLRFVSWKQMCRKLNKNMIYEMDNYY